jgi:competence protein ComEC
VKKKNIPFALLAAGQEVDIGGGTLKILNPPPQFFTGEGALNNNSIVARLVYGNFAMLLAADAEREAEAAMVKKFGTGLRSQVLKSGHHGSRTSSAAAFLKAVDPEVVVISVGAGNEYHHPHPSVLKRYADKKIKIYRTDTDGTVTITSDGKTYEVFKEK